MRNDLIGGAIGIIIGMILVLAWNLSKVATICAG